MQGISLATFAFGKICPSVGGSFALSQLVVDVSIVLAEFRRSLIVARSRVTQLFAIDLIKIGLSLLIIELGLRSTSVIG